MCQFRCTYTGEGTTLPVGFPRRSRRGIVATSPPLFSPSSNRCCDRASVAIATSSKDNLAGIELRSLRRSQGSYRRRISIRIGKRISMVSAGNCAGKTASFRWPKSFRHLGQLDSQFHRNVEANRTLLAVEISRDSPPQTATISPLIATFSARTFDPANQGRTHYLPALQKSTQKTDNILRIAGVNNQG